jgi:hypothetical protein
MMADFVAEIGGQTQNVVELGLKKEAPLWQQNVMGKAT